MRLQHFTYLATDRVPISLGSQSNHGQALSMVLKNKRILIVEDSYLVSMQIEDALCDAGADIVGVLATGEEAVDLGVELRPDLVIMDIRLAGTMTGIEAAKQLNAHGIVSLFASAHSNADMRAAGEAANPAGWLVKPFSASDLLAAVTRALSSIRDN